MPEVTSSYAPGTPCWVDLMTSDPEAARAFYGGLFGWEFEIGPPEAGYYTQARVRGLAVAGLGGQPKPDELPVAWTTYLASDDLETTVKRILESGGTIAMAPLDVMGEGSMAIAADPTGAVFGLWQAGRHIGARLVNEPGAVCWNELGTRDWDSARRFYSDVFGWEWEDVDTGPDGPPYAIFSVGGRSVGGSYVLGEQMPAEVPPNWMTSFAVADADAAVARTQELGGGVSMPAVDSPYGRLAVLRDPQGGVFSVIRLSEQA
jgi:predicted enzyme related to lactoylglutathione lyase